LNDAHFSLLKKIWGNKTPIEIQTNEKSLLNKNGLQGFFNPTSQANKKAAAPSFNPKNIVVSPRKAFIMFVPTLRGVNVLMSSAIRASNMSIC